ncbi:hypothetical protein RJ639_023642 [Escallonia herrerae]|uniref:H15 domain-containing protein n=1 Tax=Escallonia herrerae TaxID=1293975 RepID=A0AA89AE58_9ASTE|nr:hypothetical protein RJ639_023642 [Escallonia herrerae]
MIIPKGQNAALLPSSIIAEVVPMCSNRFHRGHKRTVAPVKSMMIFAAIDALKEKEGSNKSSIYQYIESTYGDLPAGLGTPTCSRTT